MNVSEFNCKVSAPQPFGPQPFGLPSGPYRPSPRAPVGIPSAPYRPLLAPRPSCRPLGSGSNKLPNAKDLAIRCYDIWKYIVKCSRYAQNTITTGRAGGAGRTGPGRPDLPTCVCCLCLDQLRISLHIFFYIL